MHFSAYLILPHLTFGALGCVGFFSVFPACIIVRDPKAACFSQSVFLCTYKHKHAFVQLQYTFHNVFLCYFHPRLGFRLLSTLRQMTDLTECALKAAQASKPENLSSTCRHEKNVHCSSTLSQPLMAQNRSTSRKSTFLQCTYFQEHIKGETHK